MLVLRLNCLKREYDASTAIRRFERVSNQFIAPVDRSLSCQNSCSLADQGCHKQSAASDDWQPRYRSVETDIV